MQNNIEGFNGKLIEETTIAATPKLSAIIILAALIIHAIVAHINERIDAKYERQKKEIPLFIQDKIVARKKESKYTYKGSKKHGTKKKHRR